MARIGRKVEGRYAKRREERQEDRKRVAEYAGR
jgi:hypothetical protein